MYEPSVLIFHQIGSARLSRRWLVRRAWAQGTSNARARALDHEVATDEAWRACRADAAAAARSFAATLRAVRRDPQEPGLLLNELGRGAGHCSAAVEHVRLRCRAGLGTLRGSQPS